MARGLAAKVEQARPVLLGDEIDKAESATGASDTTLPAYKKKVESRVVDQRAPGQGGVAEAPWQRPSATAMFALEAKGAPLPPLAAGGVQAAIADGRLTLKEAATGRAIADIDAKGLEVKPPKTAGAEKCELVPYVRELAVDASRRVFVLTVGQISPSGDPVCFAGARTVAYRWKP